MVRPLKWLLERLCDGKTLVFLVFSCLLLYLVIAPLVVLVFGSFKSVAPGTPEYFSLDLTLENYRRAFGSRYLPRATLNTAIFALGSSSIAFVLGAFLAWVTERTNSPLRSLLYVMAVSRVILPGVLVTFAWIVLLSPQIGILNRLLIAGLGLSEAPFNIYSMAGLIWVEGIDLTPLAFLLMASAFQSMDPSLEEAATVAGSGPLESMRRVTLPMMKPALLSAAVLLLIRGIESFRNAGVDWTAGQHLCLYHGDLAQLGARAHRLWACGRVLDGSRDHFRRADHGLSQTHRARRKIHDDHGQGLPAAARRSGQVEVPHGGFVDGDSFFGIHNPHADGCLDVGGPKPSGIFVGGLWQTQLQSVLGCLGVSAHASRAKEQHVSGGYQRLRRHPDYRRPGLYRGKDEDSGARPVGFPCFCSLHRARDHFRVEHAMVLPKRHAGLVWHADDSFARVPGKISSRCHENQRRLHDSGAHRSRRSGGDLPVLLEQELYQDYFTADTSGLGDGMDLGLHAFIQGNTDGDDSGVSRARNPSAS